MAYLKTIKKAMQPVSYGSLSPDDMKVPVEERVNRIGLNALTKTIQGTGQRAPWFRPRRQQFTQNYYKGTIQHADNTLGDPFGTQTRKEETAGGISRFGQ